MHGVAGIACNCDIGFLRLDLPVWSVYNNTSSERKAAVVFSSTGNV